MVVPVEGRLIDSAAALLHFLVKIKLTLLIFADCSFGNDKYRSNFCASKFSRYV